MNPPLQLRLVVVAPPAGVAFAVQRGRTALLAPVRVAADALIFEFAVTVADASSEPVRLTGECAQGPAAARFVYVNSGTYAGDAGSCWSRRAKVPLAGIAPALVQSALARSDAILEARIAGTGRDGGPACASVPLLSGWSIV